MHAYSIITYGATGVCTYPPLGPKAGSELSSTGNDRVTAGSSLVQVTAIKRYIEHFGLHCAILPSQRKIIVAFTLWLRQSSSRNKLTDLIFSGMFAATLFQKKFVVTSYKLGNQLRCICCNRCSNARIT